MGRFRLAIPLLLLALGSTLRAQTRDVVVIGQGGVPRERLLALAHASPGDSALFAIARLYSGVGYLDVDVTSSGDDVIHVVEGRRYRFNRVDLVGPDSVLLELSGQLEQARQMAGAWFEAFRVEESSRVLLSRLSELGYGFAAVQPRLSVNGDSACVDVAYRIEPGPVVRIQSVQIRGNRATRSSLIRAAASVAPGTLLTEDLLSIVRRRVERLGLFSRVDRPDVVRNDSSGAYDLRIDVVEASVNTFDGVVGIQPADSSGGAPSVLGQVSIFLGNIFGSGRRISFRWSRQSGIGSRLELRYGEPYVLDLPVDVDIGYSQAQQEETTFLLSYVRRGLNGGATYGVSDEFRVRLGGGLDWTIPQPDSIVPCDRQVAATTSSEATIGIAYDTRTDRINPVGGLLYATSYAYGSRVASGQSDCNALFPASVSRQRVELDFEGYVPILSSTINRSAPGSIVGAFALHYRETSAERYEDGDLYRLGGISTVRGYREWSFSGTRVVWSNIEARVLLSRQSFAAVLFDVGYYKRPADPWRPRIIEGEEWIFGYGIVAQIETPIGLARVAYALGRGDTFASGKISFGLVNQF